MDLLACGDFENGRYGLWPVGNFQKSLVRKMGEGGGEGVNTA
jgi:hypothetical protein